MKDWEPLDVSQAWSEVHDKKELRILVYEQKMGSSPPYCRCFFRCEFGVRVVKVEVLYLVVSWRMRSLATAQPCPVRPVQSSHDYHVSQLVIDWDPNTLCVV
jgi:hypothetical protein